MADENDPPKNKEHFPEDSGTHTPPQGKKRDASQPTEPAEKARQGEEVPETGRKRRSFVAILIGAIILIVILALIIAR